MPHVNLKDIAHNLPQFWSSKIIGQSGNCNIKVLKMDEAEYPEEIHDYNEALIVLEGEMLIVENNETIRISAGEMYFAPAGVPHAVAKGSHGTLLIVDPV